MCLHSVIPIQSKLPQLCTFNVIAPGWETVCFQYVNGVELMRHEGGGVPFVTEIPLSLLSPASITESNGTASDGYLTRTVADIEGRITVAVNDTLTSITVPQGRWYYDGEKRSRRQELNTFYKLAPDGATLSVTEGHDSSYFH